MRTRALSIVIIAFTLPFLGFSLFISRFLDKNQLL